MNEVQRQEVVLAPHPKYRKKVREITQWNGFYAHDEGVLLGLVCSDDIEERRLGVSIILKIREAGDQEQAKKSKYGVRLYQAREIQCTATKLSELINLDEAEFEPPLLMQKSAAEIQSYIDKPYDPPPYQCISQFTERAVQATSQAVSRVSGELRQDGYTLNKMASRAEAPTINKILR